MKCLYQASEASQRLFVLSVSIFASVFLRFFYKILELFQQCGFSFSSPLRDGCDSFAAMNRFKPATLMFLSQARPLDSIMVVYVCCQHWGFASMFLRFSHYILELFQQYGISLLMVVILLQQWLVLAPLHLYFCPKLGLIIPLDSIVVVYVCCQHQFLLLWGTFIVISFSMLSIYLMFASTGLLIP